MRLKLPVFVMEKWRIFCKVGNRRLHIMQTNSRKSKFRGPYLKLDFFTVFIFILLLSEGRAREAW